MILIYIYIYIYVYIEESIFRQQVIIRVSFVKDDGTLFVKTQQSTQNYTTPDDNQKYGQKCLGRRYGTIPLPSRSQH